MPGEVWFGLDGARSAPRSRLAGLGSQRVDQSAFVVVGKDHKSSVNAGVAPLSG